MVGGLVAKSCPTLATPWMVAHPGSSLCPWDFPGKNTGMGYHFFLQGIFPTQGLNPHLLFCRCILLCWATRETQLYIHMYLLFFGFPFHLGHHRAQNQRRQWQPTPVLLPGKSQGRRSLVGCSPWSWEESDTTELTSLSLFTFMHWRRKWQSTPVFLPEESQGWWSLVGCHLWGCTESDTTEAT